MVVERLKDIDRAKGLAILLVVFGHLVAIDAPSGHEWYDVLKHAIYKFHIPFFMYLSGFVFFCSGSQDALNHHFRAYIFKRSKRLLLPFVVFGLLIIIGKYGAQFILYVDDVGESLTTGLSQMVFDTTQSPAISIWYVFVLFFYCAFTPLLWRLAGGRLLLLFVIALALYLVPFSDDFYLDRVGRFFVFFVAGGVVALHRDLAMTLFRRWFWLAFLLFALSFGFMAAGVSGSIKIFVIGFLSLPVLHQLVRFKLFEDDRILLLFGTYSFVIYLFNTIFIGLTKGVYLKVFPFSGGWFLLALFLMFVAGAIGPIVLKKYMLVRWPSVDRITA